MPVTKPTTVPRWTDVTSARRVEPIESKKDAGFAPGEKPPAQNLNWLLYWTYKWILWLQDITNQAFTWLAVQTFSVGIVVTNSTTNGRAILGTGNGTGAGCKGIGGATNGVGVEGEGTGSGSGVKGTGGHTDGSYGVECIGAGGVGFSGTGCKATGGTPSIGTGKPGVDTIGGRGAPGLNAQGGIGAEGATCTGGNNDSPGVIAIGGATNGVGCDARGTGTGAGVKAVSASGRAIEVHTGHLQCTATPPSKSADPGANNMLHADNIMKSWGQIELSGPTHTAYPNLTGLTFYGTNVATVVYANGNAIEVTFARDMVDSHYSITIGKNLTSVGGLVYDIEAEIVDAHTFRLVTGNGTTGNFETAGFNGTISFQVAGKQAT